MRFFTDFCSIFAACCKSQHRFRIGFYNTKWLSDVFLQVAFCMDLGSKKPSKNLSKTMPGRPKNRSRNRIVFQHRFFRVLASILEPLGPASWSHVGSKSFPKVFPQLPWSLLKLDAFLKWCLGRFWAQFWKPWPLILESQGSIFLRFSHIFGHVCQELAKNMPITCWSTRACLDRYSSEACRRQPRTSEGGWGGGGPPPGGLQLNIFYHW